MGERKGVLSGVFTLLITALILINTSCSDSSVSGYEYAKWSFSGIVQNGATEERLEGVRIKYLDAEGEQQSVETDSSGSFNITGLSFGEKSFRFSYSEGIDGDSTLYFTEKNINVSSHNESNTMEGVIGGKSAVVDMYPMNSSVSGRVYLRVEESERTIPADGAEVTAYYNDSSFVNTQGSGFNVTADSSGGFSVPGLPASDNISIRVSNYLYQGESYSSEEVTLERLIPGKEFVFGNIYLSSSDSIQERVYVVSSNTLTSDGFGREGVAVDAVPWYVLSQSADLESAVLEFSCFPEEDFTPEISGDTIKTGDIRNFKYNTSVEATITGMDTIGRRFQILLDGTRSFKTGSSPVVMESNVLSEDGYGLTGVEVNTVPWYVFSKSYVPSSVTASVTGLDSSEVTPVVRDDTVFINHSKNFPKESEIVVEITGIDVNGNRVVKSLDSLRTFTTEQRTYILSSNVLTEDGIGKTGVPVNTPLRYVLSRTPDQEFIDVEFIDAGEAEPDVSVRGDTLIAEHSDHFPGNTRIGVSISGEDTSGNSIDIELDSDKRFKTRQSVHAVESNAWRSSEEYKSEFSLYDTVWVRFSQVLDQAEDAVEWYSSDTDRDIYGRGEKENASVRIAGDTLCVVPDQRLSVNYGETMGFNISVLAESGSVSDSIEVSVPVMERTYSVAWTNTKDEMGNMRKDMSVMDSIVVVPNTSIGGIRGVSGYNDRTLPADMMLDNIRLRGDTIVYVPQVPFSPGVTYGIDFDITDPDGIRTNDILGVMWGCQQDIRIVSADNRENGVFREFASIGDTLRVEFSKGIDTSSNAPVEFRVKMEDVNGNMIQTGTVWESDNKAVLIYNTTPYPVADYDAPLGNTEEAYRSRAVNSVAFDLTAEDGEQAYNLSPANDSIEIHTEPGLVPVESNILESNNSDYAVLPDDKPVSGFSASGAVSVTFNRALDVSAITSQGDSLFAGLVEDGGDVVASEISFSNSDRTLIITPDAELASDTDYHVWFRYLPGLNISEAEAVNDHSGRFSGQADGNHLLDRSFSVE